MPTILSSRFSLMQFGRALKTCLQVFLDMRTAMGSPATLSMRVSQNFVDRRVVFCADSTSSGLHLQNGDWQGGYALQVLGYREELPKSTTTVSYDTGIVFKRYYCQYCLEARTCVVRKKTPSLLSK